MRPLLLLLATLLAPGCLVTVDESPPGLYSAVVTKPAPSRAWLVMQGEEAMGSVVRFALGKGSSERFFFAVRNRWGQDLGLVDALGRAWRHRPHAQEPEWIGTGTALEGAQLILTLGPEAALREVSVGALASASARFAGR